MKNKFGWILRFFLVGWGLLFIGLLVVSKGNASGEPAFFEDKTSYEQVLVVFSYDLTNYASLEKYAQILEQFDQVDEVNFSFEFFDAAKTSLDDYTQVKAQVLFNKYQSLLPFDLIVVFDDEALLLIQEFTQYDARSPIFYSGIENVDLLNEFGDDVEMFGFTEYLGIFETVEMAKKLLPEARKVYFLFDQSIESKFYQDEINKNSEFFSGLGLTPIFIKSEENSFNDVADWLSKLSEEDIVVFHSFNKDVNGDYLNNENLFSYFSSFSTTPIFTLFEPKNGFLGGFVTNERQEAAAVAAHAIDFLAGEITSKNITHDDIGIHYYVIDEQVFEKYNLNRDVLPEGVIFVNPVGMNLEISPQQLNFMMMLFVILLFMIFNSQMRLSHSTNKLLEMEKISLQVKAFFNELSFEHAIDETLNLLNLNFKSFLSIYAVLNRESGKFEVQRISDSDVSSIDHFLENCKIVEYPDIQKNINLNRAFVSQSRKDLKFYSLSGITKRVKIKSCLFLPIELQNKVNHYIILFSKTKKIRINKKEASAFNMLANILSSGIMNSQLEENEAGLIHSIFLKNQEMEYILSHSDNLIVTFDQNSNILEMNRRAREILGVTVEDFADFKYEDFIHSDDLSFKKKVQKNPELFVEQNNPVKVRTRMRTALFGYRWYEWVVFFFTEKGKIVKRVSIGHDVTATMEREREMEYLLTHDVMTELHNSTYVKQVLKELLPGESAFCAYINISNFRQVNESFGHKVGDEFLIKLGKRLKKNFHGVEQTVVARVSGDEFVVLITAGEDERLDEEKIKQIFMQLNATPIVCSKNQITFHLTIGYATYPELAEDAVDIYRYAEVAMFESKKSNIRGYQKFEHSIYDRQIQQHEVTKDVEQAMANEEFEMFYQPIENVQAPNKVYLESLLRWHHPEKGLLTPGYFLDIVESNGQIIEISRLMFEKICVFLEEQKKNGFYIDSISFNLCVASLRLRNEAEFFIQMMKDHYVLPSQIVIEITESLFFENKLEVNRNLKMFREFGIEVAIDDFGMEYSTLSMLENVEYDVIKLDQHFTKNLGTKNADLVVNMIHELCVYNNKRCIVEGVEEKAQLDTLLERGFVEFQGYYYARPMPSSELERYYSKQLAFERK